MSERIAIVGAPGGMTLGLAELLRDRDELVPLASTACSFTIELTADESKRLFEIFLWRRVVRWRGRKFVVRRA